MKLKITVPRLPDVPSDLRDTIGFALVVWIVCMLVALLLTPGCVALARCRTIPVTWTYYAETTGEAIGTRIEPVTICRY